MNTTTVALITAVALIGVVAWFDAFCLADLANTSDRDLRYFNRNTWALVIVLSFPIGPMLYLLYARGPPPIQEASPRAGQHAGTTVGGLPECPRPDRRR